MAVLLLPVNLVSCHATFKENALLLLLYSLLDGFSYYTHPEKAYGSTRPFVIIMLPYFATSLQQTVQ